MEKKEFGWCAHVKASGIYARRGTALKVESQEPVYFVPATESIMVVFCHDCYLKSDYHLIQFTQHTA